MARTVGAVKAARAASDAVYSDLIAYVNAEIKHYKQEVIASKKGATASARLGNWEIR